MRAAWLPQLMKASHQDNGQGLYPGAPLSRDEHMSSFSQRFVVDCSTAVSYHMVGPTNSTYGVSDVVDDFQLAKVVAIST